VCRILFFNRILLSGIVSPHVLGEALDAYQQWERLWMSKSACALNEETAKLFKRGVFVHTKFLPVFLKPVRELTTRRSDSWR